MNRFKTPLLLFLFGSLLTIVGAWLKITHQPYADATITIGMALLLVAILSAIYKIVSTKKSS